MALKVNSILIKKTMEDKMILLYQLNNVGGDLLNPTIEYFVYRYLEEKQPVVNLL